MSRTYVKEKYKAQWGAKDSYLDKDVAVKIVPAPIKGWDALSPIAAMEPQYAVTLDNWVPRTGYCEIRGGYNAWAQGLSTGPINTLMTYRPASGDEMLFAAAGSTIYDVSTYGSYTASLTGLNSDKFQYVNFTPSGGASYLVIASGQDLVRNYNGTAWSTPAITGVLSSTFIHVTSFKRRLWFVEVDSTRAWYLGTDAIAGAATALDLGPFMTKGGYLNSIVTWTVDGGTGPDDYLVFITSKGQYIVYKGTDPTNANAWAMIGTFDVASPIGRRCAIRFGADDFVITTQGVLPVSQTLPFDPAASRSVAITNRIQNAMLQSAQLYNTNFGWEIISFPAQALLLLNIPQVEGQTQVQYVMNTITGAWCSFSGWNANCFEIYNESLYFGGNTGSVNLAYTGGLDYVSPIQYTMKCAFNYLDEPGRIKNANMIRPFFVADGTISPQIAINVDFADDAITAPVTSLSPVGAIWDTSVWDTGTWAQGTITVTNWLSCNALGTALSINMAVNISGSSASQAALSSVFDIGTFDTMVFDGNGNITASGLNIPVLRVNVFELLLENGGPV